MVWIQDLGSGIHKKLISDQDPGVKMHRIPDPQHWSINSLKFMPKYLTLTLFIYDTDLVECNFVFWSLPAGYAWDLEQKNKN
jgi:hypothetical protein